MKTKLLILSLLMSLPAMAREGGAGADGGRGTLGRDLLDFKEITDARLVRLNNEVIGRVTQLKLTDLPELKTLRRELNVPILEMTQDQYKDGNQYPGDWTYGGLLYGYTDLKPGAPTFIYPVAYSSQSRKRLSDVQIKQLLLHEALHRALPSPVNGHENVVVSITRFVLLYAEDQIISSIQDELGRLKDRKQILYVGFEPGLRTPESSVSKYSEWRYSFRDGKCTNCWTWGDFPSEINMKGDPIGLNAWGRFADLLESVEIDLDEYTRIQFLRASKVDEKHPARFWVRDEDLRDSSVFEVWVNPRSDLADWFVEVEKTGWSGFWSRGGSDHYYRTLDCRLQVNGQRANLLSALIFTAQLVDGVTGAPYLIKGQKSVAPSLAKRKLEYSSTFRCSKAYVMQNSRVTTRKKNFQKLAGVQEMTLTHVLDSAEEVDAVQVDQVKTFAQALAKQVTDKIREIGMPHPQQ